MKRQLSELAMVILGLFAFATGWQWLGERALRGAPTEPDEWDKLTADERAYLRWYFK